MSDEFVVYRMVSGRSGYSFPAVVVEFKEFQWRRHFENEGHYYVSFRRFGVFRQTGGRVIVVCTPTPERMPDDVAAQIWGRVSDVVQPMLDGKVALPVSTCDWSAEKAQFSRKEADYVRRNIVE